ncbi:MAG: hypothetical protein ACRCV3_00715 [Desulfovibrionaceae bacterium]
MNAIIRGILLGASLGFITGLFFTEITQAFKLGMYSGFLAGLTNYIRSRGKNQ